MRQLHIILFLFICLVIQGQTNKREATKEDYEKAGFVMPEVNPAALSTPTTLTQEYDHLKVIQPVKVDVPKLSAPEMPKSPRNSLKTSDNDIRELRKEIQRQAQEGVQQNTSHRVYDIPIDKVYDTKANGKLVPKTESSDLPIVLISVIFGIVFIAILILTFRFVNKK